MSSDIHYSTGRRKTSSARVYLKKGKGNEIHITDAIKILIKENLKFVGHKFEGKYLIKGGKIDAKETDLWKPKRIVLVKFPNKSSALRWYNSEEYRALKHLRLNNASSNILFIEGV